MVLVSGNSLVWLLTNHIDRRERQLLDQKNDINNTPAINDQSVKDPSRNLQR